MRRVAYLANFGVVLVAIDATRLLVLLAVNRVTVLFCQVTVVLRAHAAFFLVDARFLVLKAGGLASSELSALHAVCDPVLLIDFALVDVLVILAVRRGGGLGEHGGWGEGEGCDH